MTKVGLVLGGGGVVGQAYHAGVLSALEHDVGWDPREADVIVGTSAGAIVGTLLRGGVAPSDLAAWTVKAPLAMQSDMLVQLFGEEMPHLAPMGLRHVLRPLHLPSQAMVRRALLRPWKFRPSAALLTLLAPGTIDVVEHLAPLREIEITGWPERDLWIPAVRRADGRRVVFGRPGSPAAPLHLAVAATSAVPGYFAPVHIDGRAYVDGGAHSSTNAAVLAGRGLDLVVVVSPMTGPSPPTGVNGLIRRHAARRLGREVRALRGAGLDVVVFEPGAGEVAAMGRDLLSHDPVNEVVQTAFIAAGAHAAKDEVRRLLPSRRQ